MREFWNAGLFVGSREGGGRLQNHRGGALQGVTDAVDGPEAWGQSLSTRSLATVWQEAEPPEYVAPLLTDCSSDGRQPDRR